MSETQTTATTVATGGILSEALALATRPEGLRTADLVEAGHSRRTAQRAIKELTEQGCLVPHGNGRSRVYRCSKQS